MNTKTTLNEQVERTLNIAQEVLNTTNLIANGKDMLVSTAQESVLESYADMLESREKELIEEMQKIVVEYSAKIATTRSLLRSIGRESERRVVWQEKLEGEFAHE